MMLIVFYFYLFFSHLNIGKYSSTLSITGHCQNIDYT